MTIRADLYKRNKGIHVKLEKNTHAALRGKLFYYDVSMQELFNEFANLIVTEHAGATSIIQQLVRKKIHNKIAELKTQRIDKKFDVIDHDAIYDLIDDEDISLEG